MSSAPNVAINSPIQPEIHDPPQSGPLQIKQLREGDPVAANHPVDQLARFVNRGQIVGQCAVTPGTKSAWNETARSSVIARDDTKKLAQAREASDEIRLL